MQDLLLAQKRDRPAYCFKHLHLELRSHDDGAQANSATAGATFAPGHDLVACFEPEWNSLDVNKTRSFNILGGFETPECTVLLHSLRQREPPSRNLAHGVVKFS
jgi:hypothetical protein